jgi:hypothetical protein
LSSKSVHDDPCFVFLLSKEDGLEVMHYLEWNFTRNLSCLVKAWISMSWLNTFVHINYCLLLLLS